MRNSAYKQANADENIASLAEITNDVAASHHRTLNKL